MPEKNQLHPPPEKWQFRLYIAGYSQLAERTRRNLEALCQVRLKGEYNLEIIDIKQDPERASRDQVFAIPLVVRVKPEPERRVVGDLSLAEKAGEALGLPSDCSIKEPGYGE